MAQHALHLVVHVVHVREGGDLLLLGLLHLAALGLRVRVLIGTLLLLPCT